MTTNKLQNGSADEECLMHTPHRLPFSEWWHFSKVLPSDAFASLAEHLGSRVLFDFTQRRAP
jgi:hypothetical protein